MLEFIIAPLEAILNQFGLFAIFVTMVLESALIPIPSEIVVPFGGFLASKGYFSLFTLVIVTSLANLVGSIIAYYVGVKMTWIHKIKFLEEHLELSQRTFDKHGLKMIFFGRMLPAVRTFISLPAGIAKVPIWEFATLTFLGALPWNFALGYFGFLLGENWELVHSYGTYITIAIVLAIPITYFLYKKYEEKLRE
ncbi:MAG: DedA family protein [Candidatus Altiarchaeota archaeon]|nr:DedA family protein [Candidatus Altiarchaeota archaeon]